MSTLHTAMTKHRLRCFCIIRFKFLKEAEWLKRLLRLDFRYAKIRIIRLICDIFGLIYIKKKHRFYPTGSTWTDRLILPRQCPISAEQARETTVTDSGIS